MPSSKRSAASSKQEKQRSERPFFVDRAVGRYLAVQALRDAGFEAIAHDDRFEQGTQDEDWLTVAGQEGWIVITRDKMIRRRQSELEALRAARVIAFVITAGNATGTEIAELLRRIAQKMHNIAISERPPAVYSVSLSGKPTKVALPRSH